MKRFLVFLCGSKRQNNDHDIQVVGYGCCADESCKTIRRKRTLKTEVKSLLEKVDW